MLSQVTVRIDCVIWRASQSFELFLNSIVKVEDYSVMQKKFKAFYNWRNKLNTVFWRNTSVDCPSTYRIVLLIKSFFELSVPFVLQKSPLFIMEFKRSLKLLKALHVHSHCDTMFWHKAKVVDKPASCKRTKLWKGTKKTQRNFTTLVL